MSINMFDTLVSLYPHSDKAALVAQSLKARYAESHRRYHTSEHIGFGLEIYKSLMSVPLTPHQITAWLYHDAVYNCRSQDNEYQSAVVFAKDRPKLGVDLKGGEIIVDFILSTVPTFPEGNIIKDMDLAILGAEPSVYYAYSLQIREEYRLAGVNDEQWRLGRSAVLKHFLGRSIYTNSEFAAKFTAQAYTNLKQELRELDGTQ